MRYLTYMRRAVLAAVLGLGVMGGQSAFAQQELAPGAAMPGVDQPLRSTAGGDVSLSSLRGSAGTVVVFWSNDCPWVSKYEERLLSLSSAYSGQGFAFVLVNSNDPEAFPKESFAASQERARQGSYALTYVSDPTSALATAFGAVRTPHAYVFNSSGNLAYVGTIDDSPGDPGNVQASYLQQSLDAVAAGIDVSMPRTKAFGCTIKLNGG